MRLSHKTTTETHLRYSREYSMHLIDGRCLMNKNETQAPNKLPTTFHLGSARVEDTSKVPALICIPKSLINSAAAETLLPTLLPQSKAPHPWCPSKPDVSISPKKRMAVTNTSANPTLLVEKYASSNPIPPWNGSGTIAAAMWSSKPMWSQPPKPRLPA